MNATHLATLHDGRAVPVALAGAELLVIYNGRVVGKLRRLSVRALQKRGAALKSALDEVRAGAINALNALVLP